MNLTFDDGYDELFYYESKNKEKDENKNKYIYDIKY